MIHRATSSLIGTVLGTVRLLAVGAGGALSVGSVLALLAGLDRTVTGERLERPVPVQRPQEPAEPRPSITETEAAMELGRMGVMGLIALVAGIAATYLRVTGIIRGVFHLIPLLIKGSVAGTAFLVPVVAGFILLDRLLMRGVGHGAASEHETEESA